MLGGQAAQLELGHLLVPRDRGNGAGRDCGSQRRCSGNAHGFCLTEPDRASALFDGSQPDQRAFHFLVQQEGAMRRRDTRPVAVEQRVAEICFEFLDLPCDSRLRAFQQAACSSDAAGRHDRRKRFELM
jgi:hypothetical protein